MTDRGEGWNSCLDISDVFYCRLNLGAESAFNPFSRKGTGMELRNEICVIP